MHDDAGALDLRFHSSQLALAFHRREPRIGHLGVESGGRGRGHLDRNLLMPGHGAGVPGGAAVDRVRETDDGIVYEGVRVEGGQVVDLSCRVADDRSFAVEVAARAPAGGPPAFEMVLDPVSGCPSVWSASADTPRYPEARPAPGELPPLVNRYGLPLLVHFPDRGFLRVEADGVVACEERWEPSDDRRGLSLGLTNRGYHTEQHAYHHGRIRLRFAAADGRPLRLRFVVENEHCPALPPECGPEWDGLRRCWHNAFTRDRRVLTMGDNPLLSGIAHLAVHFKSEMALFAPALLPGVSLHDTLGRALDLGFTHAQGPSGEVNWRFAEDRFKDATEVTGFVDSTPSNLVALHHHIAATRDWSLFEKHREGVRRAAAFLLGLEKNGNGMLELPYHGCFFDEADGGRTRNWWDNVAFGHWDACFMLLCHHALVRTQELFETVGLADDAGRIRGWRKRFARAFHKEFWQPATRRYAGWVDAQGKAHDYAFTFVNAMAVNEGIVPVGRGRAILRAMLRDMRRLGYDGVYGVPGNLVPFQASDTISWDVLGRWGVYENGGLCGMAAGHFLKALYRVGLREDADRIFFRMLDTFEREDTHSGPFPGYARSVDWRTKEGRPCGYNYLADNYYFLVAGLTGHLGWQPPALPPPA